MSPGEIAEALARTFDSSSSTPLEKAIAQLLRMAGYGNVQADLEASSVLPQVLGALKRTPPQSLPFDVSDGRPVLLVGKGRARGADNELTRAAREKFDLIPLVQSAVYRIGSTSFEWLCCRLMIEEGSVESLWNGAPDDGGIDLYGRIPVRAQSGEVPDNLLRTALLTKTLLFLGQAKCYDPKGEDIGRGTIDAFHGQLEICLSKYEGNARPPSHRVPEGYYNRNEMALGVLFTSASYSGPATSAAGGLDIQLVDGHQIAEFLVARAVVSDYAGEASMIRSIAAWAAEGQEG